MERLVSSARTGDERAWKALFERDKESVYRIAYRITLNRQEALDVVQETFSKAFLRLDQLAADQAWSGWVRSIAVNAAISRTRQLARVIRWFGHRTEESVLVDERQHIQSPREEAFANELSEALHKALHKLSAQQRAVASLFFDENLSGSQIAEVLSLSTGTVKSHLFRARRQIQRDLKVFLR